MDKNSKQNLRYLYRVYGMNIESDIEIKEFINADEFEEDDEKVIINQCEIKKNIKDKIKNGLFGGSTENEIWFNIRNTAVYQIVDGNTINFEIYENADMDQVKIYLTCSCLGFIMIQREKLAIHGGVIIDNEKAIVITGERGAGKSTITTAFRLRGFKFLSDDVAALSDSVPIRVHHGFPYEKLCIDAMKNFNYDKSKYQSFMGDTKIKYMVPAIEHFSLKDIPLGCIIELKCENVQQVQLIEVKGIEKLSCIIKSIYRGEYLESIQGISSNYMKKCVNLSKNIRYYRITRPEDKFTVQEQMELIEKIIKEDLKNE